MDKFVLSQSECEFLGYFIEKIGHNYALKTNSDPAIYAIDCEFVMTDRLEIAIVYFNNQTYYVKTKNTINDYFTNITGIDENTTFTHTFDEIITILTNNIAENDILVGHHMYNDLKLLNFYHKNIIDTCMIFPHPDGPPHYYSLKYLAHKHLHREIQTSTHSAEIDANTALDLIKFCVENKFIKTNWLFTGQIFEPSYDLISKIIGPNITAIYLRGSRVIGTNKYNSDYDIVVVVNDNIIDNALTRYGNLDIVTYSEKYFINAIKNHIVWILECIFSNEISPFMYETKDYRKILADYRLICHNCNYKLRESVSYEASRKKSSAKKHFENGDLHAAKKHYFIAARFINYGLQVAKYGKIKNLREINWLWFALHNLPKNTYSFSNFKAFKDHFRPFYGTMYSEFIKLAPKMEYNEEIENINFKSSINIDHNLTLQEYLRNYGEIALKDTYKINYYQSKKYPELFQFKYTNMSPKSIITDQCRGIILNKMDNWSIIAYPMDKFEEGYINNGIIYEKLDGSTAILYFYKTWNVATNRNPDGDSLVGIRGTPIKFDELFWRIFEKTTLTLDITITYVFELISPLHPIIINYEKDELYLICMRQFGQEIDIRSQNLFKIPKIFDKIEPIDSNIMEGYVIIHDGKRYKVKSEEYIKRAFKFPLCHRDISIDKLLHIIQIGEKSEFLTHCPAFSDQLLEIEGLYNNFVNKSLELYKNLDSRRDFAKYVKTVDKKYHSILYALYDKIDPYTFMAQINMKTLKNLLMLS